MPVVISYEPVGAIGEAASNIGSRRIQDEGDRYAMETARMNQEGAYRNQQQRLALRQQRQQADEFAQTQQYRYDEMAQRGQQQDDELQLAYDKMASEAPQEYVDPDSGQTFQFTRNQQAAYQNIKSATGGQGPDFDAGLRKLTGVPEPTQEYDLEGPDGETYRLPLTPKELVAAVDKGYKQKVDQQRAAIAQQAADQRATAHQDYVTAQNARIDLEEERINLLKTNADAKTLAEFQKRVDEVDDEVQKKAEAVATNEIAQAREALSAYTQQRGGTFKLGDPVLQQLQNAVKAKIAAKGEVVAAGLAMLQKRKNAPSSNAGTPGKADDGNAAALPPVAPAGTLIRQKSTGKVFKSDGKQWLLQPTTSK